MGTEGGDLHRSEVKDVGEWRSGRIRIRYLRPEISMLTILWNNAERRIIYLENVLRQETKLKLLDVDETKSFFRRQWFLISRVFASFFSANSFISSQTSGAYYICSERFPGSIKERWATEIFQGKCSCNSILKPKQRDVILASRFLWETGETLDLAEKTKRACFKTKSHSLTGSKPEKEHIQERCQFIFVSWSMEGESL